MGYPSFPPCQYLLAFGWPAHNHTPDDTLILVVEGLQPRTSSSSRRSLGDLLNAVPVPPVLSHPSKKTEPGPLRSIPLPSIPLPSPLSCFLHRLYINWGTTFSNKYGSVIYGCDRIVEAFDLVPILGEISGLVCNLEDKTSQNDCFLTQMLKSDP